MMTDEERANDMSNDFLHVITDDYIEMQCSNDMLWNNFGVEHSLLVLQLVTMQFLGRAL